MSGFPPRGVGAIAVLVVLALILFLGDRAGEEEASERDSGESAAGTGTSADVLRVVDGDTIEVDIDGTIEDVRYIGVDTPETVKPGTPVECFGKEASDFNHDLVEDRAVRLEFDRELRDDYGRLLAYVFADDELVNAELVAGGYARTLEIEPNTSRAAQLGRLEAQAGTAGRGLWGAC